MIRLWKGYHSPLLLPLIQETWLKEDLLVLCPPLLKDFSFLSFLPQGTIELTGTWDQAVSGIQNEILKRQFYTDYPDKPVLGVFTSGTVSGSPRLILYSKENIKSCLSAIADLYDLSRIEAIFCYPQPFHTFGLLLGYVFSELYHLQLITNEGKYSSHFHESWANVRTPKLLTLGTPTHFQDLIQYLAVRKQKINPTYTCILGGAPVTVSLWKNVREKLFIEAPSIGYGATEASPGITHHPPGQRPTEDGEIGYPFRHLTIHLESDRGIEFSGKSVCLAMIQKNKIEFPRSVLIKDRISIRSDGMFLYQGRLELTLNRGGEKFPLEEIEQKIQKSFGFENLCVAIPHSRLGEDLGILIKIKEIRNPGQQKKMIQDLLKEAYGIHFELSHFSEVNEFPINSASKVDRKTALQILNSN